MLGMPILIILTSDSVKLNLENPPRGPREKLKTARRAVAAVFTLLMAAISMCIILFHMNPEEQPFLTVLSGLSALGLCVLAV
jgi:lipopolysaccharide export LptBFGC system permease protein LptF